MTGKEAKARLKKQYERQNEYQKANYDRVTVMLPKGTKEKILAQGEKPGTLLNRLCAEWLADRQRIDK